MLPRRPRLRLDSLSSPRPPTSYIPVTTSSLGEPEPEYSHTSVFRSYRMTLSVHCNSVKMSREGAQSSGRHLPVYGDHDRVKGNIGLDHSVNLSSGRLVVSIEGAFLYKSSQISGAMSSSRQRHVFFSSSTVLSPASDGSSPKSATVSSIREAFTRPTLGRKGSFGTLTHKRSNSSLRDAPQRTFQFSFDLPTAKTGEDLPPTFSPSSGAGNNSTGEEEIVYRIVSTWEPYDDPAGREVLDVPIIVQPDSEFQSFDAMAGPESWLEIPLRSDRPIPCHYAVTLPTPSVFSRSSSLPYFVVFSITPKDPKLAREVAMDATITVSLLRQIVIEQYSPSPRPSPGYQPTVPPTPPSSAGEESDTQSQASSHHRRRRHRLLKRVVTGGSANTPTRVKGGRSLSTQRQQKPLPPAPLVVQESQTIQTSVSIGFPKRPRSHTQTTPGGHPSLDAHNALPDGLYKGRLQLNKGMLPSLEWHGISIKYYLEVSVLYGQDDMRARVPVKLY